LTSRTGRIVPEISDFNVIFAQNYLLATLWCQTRTLDSATSSTRSRSQMGKGEEIKTGKQREIASEQFFLKGKLSSQSSG
jgi:hypothetical protein